MMQAFLSSLPDACYSQVCKHEELIFRFKQIGSWNSVTFKVNTVNPVDVSAIYVGKE